MDNRKHTETDDLTVDIDLSKLMGQIQARSQTIERVRLTLYAVAALIVGCGVLYFLSLGWTRLNMIEEEHQRCEKLGGIYYERKCLKMERIPL